MIAGSYLLSRITRRVIHKGMPLAASIEPTNYCNLRCPECPSGTHHLTRKRGYLDEALFQSVIEQLSPSLRYLTLYFEGEPYLHPRFFDFISLAVKKGIFVSTSTNGHFLDAGNAKSTTESGLNRLIISLDGADRQTYEQYRKGGDFEKVMDGIKTLVAMKKKMGRRNPEIVLQTLVLRSNEHQMQQIRQMVSKLGVDKVLFKTAQFYDFENGNPLMPEQSRYSRYKKEDNGQYRLKMNRPNSCFRMWSSCVITWDGWVVPCCFDKDARYAFGNLKNTAFREIWNGPLAHEFRKKILSNRKSVDICNNCTQSF
jgi:radical SAM protein with 4Fe4S-binding SPASM domain